MKILLATTTLLFATTASADWEAAWGTDELMINHEGYVSEQSVTVDPIAESGFGNDNPELFAGHEADGISASGLTAYEQLSIELHENGA